MESSKPRKQRKRHYTLALHEIQKEIAGHLSKVLREKYGKRSITLRKGDEVIVMRGKFKKKKGKITKIEYKRQKVFIERITKKKADGTEKPIAFIASNLLVTAVATEDQKRFGKEKRKKEKKEEKK